jgi:cytosine/adenosine deaminase-related metal-dependent hydrolase
MHSASPIVLPSIDGVVVVAPKWLVPVSSSPIRDGYLVIGGSKILHVGAELPPQFASIRRINLPRVAIAPGLINAHCHLEFSDLTQPIPAGPTFPDWIKRLIAFRTAQSESAPHLMDNRKAAIEAGLRESYSHGVRWIVDMTTQPWDPVWCQTAFSTTSFANNVFPTVVQPCIEMLDVTEPRAEQSNAFLQKHLHAPTTLGAMRCGLAPHASYTASTEMTRRMSELSRSESRLISMHLAESEDEMAWMRSHSGPFKAFLQAILQPSYLPKLGSIDDRLESLRLGWRSLVAHANFLSDSQVRFIAENALNMAIVHCPRTHQFFGHQHPDGPSYPLAERLALGAVHLIGTDSRASNPDLNLWAEAQTIRATHPEVSSQRILRMLTCDAAAFLSVPAEDYGALRVGSPAALTAIDLTDCIEACSNELTPDRLYDHLLNRNTLTLPLEQAIAGAIQTVTNAS